MSSPIPLPSTTTTVGAVIPGAKPVPAASAARASCVSAGRPLIRRMASFVPGRPVAQRKSSPSAEEHDHECDRARRSEAGERHARGRREGILPVGLVVAGPEDEAAEDREHRRDQRDRDHEGDRGGHGEAGAEGAEEVELADEERCGSRDDDQPCGCDDRRHANRCRQGGLDGRAPLEERAPHPGEVEDGVVGDDSEGQGDDERLHLLRDLDAEPRPDPWDQAARDEERDRSGEEREERGAERLEGQADDEQDDEHGAGLHDRQRVLHLAELLVAGRSRPRDPDRRVVGRDLARVRLGLGDPVREGGLRAEVEVGDRRRPVLARAREEAERVGDRERELNALRLLRRPAHRERSRHRFRLRGRRKPVGLSLDDERVGRQRHAEDLRVALSDLRRLGVLRDEAAERERLPRAEPGQPPRHGERSHDPGRHDEEAEADDGPREHPNRPLPDHLSPLPVVWLPANGVESGHETLVSRPGIPRTPTASPADRRDDRRVHTATVLGILAFAGVSEGNLTRAGGSRCSSASASRPSPRSPGSPTGSRSRGARPFGGRRRGTCSRC